MFLCIAPHVASIPDNWYVIQGSLALTYRAKEGGETNNNFGQESQLLLQSRHG